MEQNSSPNNDHWSLICKFKVALLQFLIVMLKSIDCQVMMLKLIPSCSILILPFLSDKEPIEVQQLAADLLLEMYYLNPGFIEVTIDCLMKRNIRNIALANKSKNAPVVVKEDDLAWHSLLSTPDVAIVLSEMFSSFSNASKDANLGLNQRKIKLMIDSVPSNSSMNIAKPCVAAGISAFKMGTMVGTDHNSSLYPSISTGIMDYLYALFVQNKGLMTRASEIWTKAKGNTEASSVNNEIASINLRMNAKWKQSLDRNSIV